MVISADNREAGGAPWTVEALIGAAQRIISSDPQLFAHPRSGSNKDLNVRLIRDYVVREFIPRPVRQGREARFGLSHLVQLLAVRILLRSQKWSLPAIKASFATTSNEDLLNGLLSPVRIRLEAEYRKAAKIAGNRSQEAAAKVQTPRLNPAQLLIEQFKASRKPQPKQSSMPILGKARPAVAAEASMVTPQIGGSSRLHIELEPWCEVVIETRRMQALTSEDVERLGETLKDRLKDETAR